MQLRFHNRITNEDSFVHEDTPNLQAIADELAQKHGFPKGEGTDIDKTDLALMVLERMLQDKK